jgi:3-oxoacyl-[acyl-carrier protein] reductase
MGQLEGRVAVVTGASRGIGRGIALELAKRGASIVVNYHSNAAAAEEVVQEITSNGGQAIAVQADVSNIDDAERLIKAALDTYEKIDILVNNAGTTRDNLIMMMKEEDFDLVINTNLKSTWNCAKHAIRPMVRKRYGRIINITSVSGIFGNPGQTNYSASKAGIIGMTRSLAREVGARNITVNAVAPGFIETDLTNELPEDLRNWVDEMLVIKRWGSIEDVANAVAFLASEEASYITGQTLTVDGGLVMS